jgi:ABC-type transport system involved in multi-copper enzyme maturation permease subunit
MIRAVIADTWRQSKQQVVFIVMLALMGLILVAGIALPRPIETADGGWRFGTILSDQPVGYFAQQWTNEYARVLNGGVDPIREALRQAGAARGGAGGERGGARGAEPQVNFQQLMQEQRRAMEEAVNKASAVPEFQRGVEYYLHVVVGWMFSVSMLLFIAACAGYFPAMLGAGAVDIVLAKPVSRMQVYFARYLGGITLYAAAIAAFCVLLLVGVGLRTGIFHWRILYAIPLLCFTAMLLYALLALIGTVSRSATMAMVIGFVFYIVVDTAIAWLLDMEPVLELMGWESAAAVADLLRHAFPNFGLLKDMALASLLTVPKFEPAPFAVALAWLAGTLGLGYWVFRKGDY